MNKEAEFMSQHHGRKVYETKKRAKLYEFERENDAAAAWLTMKRAEEVRATDRRSDEARRFVEVAVAMGMFV